MNVHEFVEALLGRELCAFESRLLRLAMNGTTTVSVRAGRRRRHNAFLAMMYDEDGAPWVVSRVPKEDGDEWGYGKLGDEIALTPEQAQRFAEHARDGEFPCTIVRVV